MYVINPKSLHLSKDTITATYASVGLFIPVPICIGTQQGLEELCGQGQCQMESAAAMDICLEEQGRHHVFF